MCITAKKAHLSKTKILSMSLENGRHLIGYANRVKNLSGEKNAMILPVPGEIKPEYFYNTSQYNHFLKDIASQSMSMNQTRSAARGMENMTKSLQIFEVGMYTVILTKNLSDLKEESICKDLKIGDELLNFMRETYAGSTFVVCIFDGNKEMDAQPILFEYEPFNPDFLFFPTMDSHSGGAPNSFSKLDHVLLYPSSDKNWKSPVRFSQKSTPEFLQNLPFENFELQGDYKNLDRVVPADREFIKSLF